MQAVKELEAAEKARKEARKEAAKKAAADKEAVKKEADDKNTPGASSPGPKQSPKAASADSDKGSKKEAEGEEEEDCTPRDAEGNELAVDIEPEKLTAAQLQQELTKRGLDVKWQPLKGKKALVDRLQVTFMHYMSSIKARACSALKPR